MKKALKELVAVLVATCVSLWPVLAVAQTPSRRGGGIKYTAAGGSSSGDVVGPASSTDNAIARFDGTTGKLLQDYTSGAPTVSDTGTIVSTAAPGITSPIRAYSPATADIAPAGVTNSGWWFGDSAGSEYAGFLVNGDNVITIGGATGFITTAGRVYGFAPSTTASSVDTSIGRASAGVVQIKDSIVIKSTGAGTPTIFEVPASTTTNTGCLLLGTGAACAAANGQYVGGTTSPLTATTVTRSTTGSADVQKAEPELITLSTVGTTTPSVGNIVPANSIIDAIACRVTTTITTATTWGVGITGDAAWNVIGTAGTTVATMTAGTTATFVAPAHNGMYNDTATTITITTTGTPGAGAIRCAVHSRTFTPPTS